MKTESGQSDKRELGFASKQGQSSVSAPQGAASDFAASNASCDSDDKRAIDQADASQSAISDNQSASFPSASFPSASFPSQSVSRDQAVGSKIPFWLIGILLTATAIAKLWMLLTDPFADVRVGLPREILWLSVAFELWLAYENFRIRDHRVMAFVNTVVFASFAIFASIRLAMGYGSCGCSGSLELPAWFFVIIDVGIVMWFAGSLARCTQIADGFQRLMNTWKSWPAEKCGRFAGSGIFVFLIAGLQVPIAAPLRAIVLGEPPLQAVVKLHDDLVLLQESTGVVTIWNRSSLPAEIIGMDASCNCFELSQDPISVIIPAHKELSFKIVVKPNRHGPLHQRGVFFLDHPKLFRLKFDLVGSVKKGVEQ